MAVAKVGIYKTSASAANPSGATVTIALNQKATAGNLLVVALYAFSQSTTAPAFTVPSGWTQTIGPVAGAGTTETDTFSVYTRTSDGTETAFTVTGVTINNGNLVGTAIEYSGSLGVDTAGSARNATSGATSITASVQAGPSYNDYLVAFWASAPNNGNGNGIPAGTWSGGVTADQTHTEVDPSDGTTGSSNAVFVAAAVGSLAAGATGSPAYAYTQQSNLSGNSAQLGVLAIKSTTAAAGGGHTVGKVYPTPTKDAAASGNGYLLSSTASTATSNSKVSIPALSVTAVTAPFIPETTNATASSPAAAPDTFANGWDLNPIAQYGDAGTLLAGTLTCSASITASQASGNATVTFIAYLNGAELARATSASTATATSATAFTANISIPQTSFPAGSKLYVSMFVTCGNTSALNATVLTLNYGTAGTSVTGWVYYLQAGRATSDTATTGDAVVRSARLARSIADAATSSDTGTRRATFPRATADASTGSDVTARVFRAVKGVVDTGTGADILTRSTLVARATSDTAAGTDTVSRILTYGRFVDDGPSDIVRNPTKVISGVTRDQAGNILGGCTVFLLRETDGLVVRTTTSDPTTGAYSFPRDLNDTKGYTIYSRKPGSSPSVQGISGPSVVPS